MQVDAARTIIQVVENGSLKLGFFSRSVSFLQRQQEISA
jgi:hypothetical protein